MHLLGALHSEDATPFLAAFTEQVSLTLANVQLRDKLRAEAEITDLAIHVEGDLSRTILRADVERTLEQLLLVLRQVLPAETVRFEQVAK